MAYFITPSFSKGEVAPSAYGRVDIAAYYVALRTAYNVVVHRFGGASNRQGTEFVGPVKTHSDTAPLLIPFQQKTTDSYVLEFGDAYMRVIRDDSYVLEAAKTITGITQANPGVVTSTAHGFSNGDELFLDGIEGMVELNGRHVLTQNVAANTFELVDQLTGDPIDTSAFGAYDSAGTASKIFELATPYSGADITETNVLKFVQSADVMTLTHNLYPIHELSRTGHTAWTIEEAVMGPSVADPTALALTNNTSGSTTYAYKVTALKRDTLEESLPGVNNTSKSITSATAANPAVFTSNSHGYEDGEEVEISAVAGSGSWATELNGERFFITNKAANTYQLTDQAGNVVDSSTWGAYPGSGVTRATFVKTTTGNATANETVEWAAVSDAERYNVYKLDNGSYGLIGTTTALEFTDDNITADLSKSHPRARNPFVGASNYPNCAAFYQQRRAFAGTLNDPDARWWSQTGLHNNFNVSTPLQDDDAITARLNSQDVQEVRHLLADQDLMEFTSSTEWRTNSGPDQRFSADTIESHPQTDWGIAFHLRPFKAGDDVLFVEDGAKRVRAFGYSFQQDKYRGPEVSLLSAHMLETYGIVDWAFCRKPEPRVFMVREDGIVLTLTYDADQQVTGWTRLQTKGLVKRVCVLRNPSGTVGAEDGVYFVVERVVNGNTVKYIEKLSSRVFTDPRDCKFVDCGLSYDNPVAIADIDVNGNITVTATAHGLGNGQEIEFSDILWVADEDEYGTETQPDQLNNNRYFVVNATTDTFQIASTVSNTVQAGIGFNEYVRGGYVRPTANLFRGFDHLEGESLVGLVDGNVFRDLVVTHGAIQLPDNLRGARAHFGLPYKAELETLNIEASNGTIQGATKAIDSVVVRFERSRGLWIGQGEEEPTLIEAKMRENEEMGDPIALLTGDKEIEIMGGWNLNGRIVIRQLDPVPFTILAVIPRAEVGG